jgi:uncharacterized membrane protein YiaA
MENAVWNLFFTSIIILLLQVSRGKPLIFFKKILLLLLAVLLIITRPEAAAWGILFSCLLGWCLWRNNKKIYFAIVLLFTFAAATLALLEFRKHYFGYPFPNTYYAKVSDNRLYNITQGFKYAFGFVVSYNYLLTILFAVLIVVCFNAIFKQRIIFSKSNAVNNIYARLFIVSIIIVASIALPFITGGDHFGGFRFYQEILLLFVWSIPVCFILWKEKSKSYFKNAVAIAMLMLLFIAANSFHELKNAPQTQLS